MVDTATSEAAAALPCGDGGRRCQRLRRGDVAPGSAAGVRRLLRGAATSVGRCSTAFARLGGLASVAARARCRAPRDRDAGAARIDIGPGVARRARNRLGGFGHRHRAPFRAPGAAAAAGLGGAVVPARLMPGGSTSVTKLRDRRCWQPTVTVTVTTGSSIAVVVVTRTSRSPGFGAGSTEMRTAAARRGSRRNTSAVTHSRQALVARAHRGCKVERLAEMRGVDGTPETERLRVARGGQQTHAPRRAWTEAIPMH